METPAKEESRDLERIYADTLHRVTRGDIARGKVVAVKSESVVVDVGYKSEGTISASEFTEAELAALREGDEIEVFIERINDQEGLVVLSRDRAAKIRSWETLSAAFRDNSHVEATVTEKTKGGLLATVLGIRAFLPSSQIDIRAVRDIDSYIGRTFPVKILKFVPPRSYADVSAGRSLATSLIVSRRAVIEEELARKREETIRSLVEGSLVKGAVKNITDYGVFIDLGGLDGLLHISDISWGRVTRPSEFFRVGDEHEFIVLKHDPATGKVTLGYKQRSPDPWLSVEDRYAPGMKVKGQVVNITDYGLFVEVEEGLEGLVHITELDWGARQKHPSKYHSVGDVLEAVVINVNKADRRLSLSVKQLKPRPWELIGQRCTVGQRVKGRVKTIADFGAFVRLPEGVDGLIHISDLSWTRHIKHPSEMLRKGQRIEAVVLSLEPEKERIALGIKQLSPDPWKDEIPARFKLGDEVRGRALRQTDFGIFVELEGGIEGLIYTSEVDLSKGTKEGEEFWVRIIKINAEERKIGLTMKNIKSHDR